MNQKQIEQAFKLAAQRYADFGVDVDKASTCQSSNFIARWQGDDVGGFESKAGLSGGGIMATGNYPGKARTADELRADLVSAWITLTQVLTVSLHGWSVHVQWSRHCWERCLNRLRGLRSLRRKAIIRPPAGTA